MDQDLLTYLAAMEQRLQKRSDVLEQRFDGMEQRFDGMEQRIDGVEHRFSQEIQELRQEVRHVHVVVEDIQDKVQLTAEVITNVNEKLDRHRDEVSTRFNDLESVMRDSDRALASRVLKVEKKLKMAV